MISSLILASLISTTPAIRPEQWWHDAFEYKKAYIATNADVKVVFVGDSITARWGMKEGRNVWAEHFASGKYKAAGCGISADRTEHVIWRLLNGQIGELKPKAFVLMIGTNNTGHRDAANETPIDTIRGIRRVVEVMRCHWPETKIVLHPIFPRGAKPTDPLRVRNEKVNAEIRALADGVRVFWCDFNDRLLEADGTLSREVMPDLLHPSEKGMRIWAENLIPTLDYVLGYTDAMPEGAKAPKADNAQKKPWEPVRSDWFDFRVAPKRGEILANLSKRYDLVMVGDSITHLWEERAQDVIREFLPNRSILNIGCSGYKTQGVLWDIDNGLLDGYRADYVSIMIGTNHRRDTAEDVAKGIEQVVKTVRAHQPTAKILLFNIFPSGEKADDKHRAKNAKTNELIRKLDNGRDIVFVELWKEFLEPDGSCSTGVFSDYLHLTPEGYSIWARKLAELTARQD